MPPISWPALPSPTNYTCSTEGSNSCTHLTLFSCSELDIALVPRRLSSRVLHGWAPASKLSPSLFPRHSHHRPCRQHEYVEHALPHAHPPLLSLPNYTFAPKVFPGLGYFSLARPVTGARVTMGSRPSPCPRLPAFTFPAPAVGGGGGVDIKATGSLRTRIRTCSLPLVFLVPHGTWLVRPILPARRS